MIKQKIQLISFFVLLLFCSSSFLSLSKAIHHSIDSVSSILHFHSDGDSTDHHRDNDHNSHSNTESKSIVVFNQQLTKTPFEQANFTLVVYLQTQAISNDFESIYLYGISSLSGLPSRSSIYSLFYPNAPPSLA